MTKRNQQPICTFNKGFTFRIFKTTNTKEKADNPEKNGKTT